MNKQPYLPSPERIARMTRQFRAQRLREKLHSDFREPGIRLPKVFSVPSEYRDTFASLEAQMEMH